MREKMCISQRNEESSHESTFIVRVAVYCSVLRCVRRVSHMRCFGEGKIHVTKELKGVSTSPLTFCVMQCVAVCCSVLQCVAVCCSVLQCVAVCCSVLQVNLESCRMHSQPQDTATRCKTLHRHATHCDTLQHTATHCNTLQHIATHCNKLHHMHLSGTGSVNSVSRIKHSTLHHTATHCNTLQHTAAHCNTGYQRRSNQRSKAQERQNQHQVLVCPSCRGTSNAAEPVLH